MDQEDTKSTDPDYHYEVNCFEPDRVMYPNR